MFVFDIPTNINLFSMRPTGLYTVLYLQRYNLAMPYQ